MKVVALIDKGRIMSSHIYDVRKVHNALDVVEVIDKEGNIEYLFPGEYKEIKEDKTSMKYKIKAFLSRAKWF